MVLSSGEAVYIPADVEDALQWLDGNLSPSVRLWLQDVDEVGAVAALSRFADLDLRDRWGLARGSRLARSLEDLGLEHPDAMAVLIITSLWRQLHQRPLRLETQLWYLQHHWSLLADAVSRGFPACPDGVQVLPGVYPGRRGYLHLA